MIQIETAVSKPEGHGTSRRSRSRRSRRIIKERVEVAPTPQTPAAKEPAQKPRNNHHSAASVRKHSIRGLWHLGLKHARLNERQMRDLEALYQQRTIPDVINVSSLNTALASPTLQPNVDAIEKCSDEAHNSGDCACRITNLSNAPVLYRQCEHVDAF
jgi:hypothetical protein